MDLLFGGWATLRSPAAAAAAAPTAAMSHVASDTPALLGMAPAPGSVSGSRRQSAQFNSGSHNNSTAMVHSTTTSSSSGASTPTSNNADGASSSSAAGGAAHAGAGAAAAAAAAALPRAVPQFHLNERDFYKYLVGAWKRNLEWREFGEECAHLRETNTVVVIEEYQKIDSELGSKHHKWSFGRTLQRNELRAGYIIKLSQSPKSTDVLLEWQFSGQLCTGKFFPATNCMVLNFYLRTSTVVAVYRIVDADVMAVCVTEVDDKEPSISYGNMYRIDQSAY